MIVFFGSLITTIIKMAVIAAVAFGGILLGKHLRTKKDEKDEK